MDSPPGDSKPVDEIAVETLRNDREICDARKEKKLPYLPPCRVCGSVASGFHYGELKGLGMYCRSSNPIGLNLGLEPQLFSKMRMTGLRANWILHVVSNEQPLPVSVSCRQIIIIRVWCI